MRPILTFQAILIHSSHHGRLTIKGVPSNLYSGRGPRLSVLKRQATSSLLKLDASI